MKIKTVEEYIEAIYALQKEHGHVHTNDLASKLEVAPPSATEMVQKLANENLVNYVPYYGVTLTKNGEKMAKDLLQKHKTLADFLVIIGIERRKAEIDACQIEHHVSTQTMKQLHKFVEFVRSAPQDPRWLEHFKLFCKTGERPECDLLDE